MDARQRIWNKTYIHQMRRFLYIAFILFLTSCSDHLADKPVVYTDEIVNGLSVRYDANMEPAHKELMFRILNSMVFVEGDCFLMGENSERAADGPAHYVRVSDYYISNMELSYKDLRVLSVYGYLSWYEWQSFIEILKEMDYPNAHLQLELTERCRNLNVNFLKEQLEFFKENGVKIALDDFGTGTSTIDLLCDLPIDCVKIDQTFILNILKIC